MFALDLLLLMPRSTTLLKMACKHFRVTGYVQGVGFRAFVRQLAEELGCRGEVWNCRDGAVELVAEHNIEAILNDLALHLRNGPGRVELVQDLGLVGGLHFAGFEIGATR